MREGEERGASIFAFFLAESRVRLGCGSRADQEMIRSGIGVNSGSETGELLMKSESDGRSEWREVGRREAIRDLVGG